MLQKLIDRIINWIKTLFVGKSLLQKLQNHYSNTYVKDPKTGANLRLQFIYSFPMPDGFHEIQVSLVNMEKLVDLLKSSKGKPIDANQYEYDLFKIDSKSNKLKQVTPLIDKYLLRMKGLLSNA